MKADLIPLVQQILRFCFWAFFVQETPFSNYKPRERPKYYIKDKIS